MDLSDEALIKLFRDTGDVCHFKVLVRRYQNRLYNAARRVLGNREEAEEVVQETCIKLLENVHRFNQQSSFAAWVFRIAYNIAIDVSRARNRRVDFRSLSFDPQSTCNGPDGDSRSGWTVKQAADPGPGPERTVDLKEQSELIEACLSELPASQSMVVVLHDIEGFSYKEIADIVGVNLGTVRSRLHYGRLKLREQLEPYFCPPDLSAAAH